MALSNWGTRQQLCRAIIVTWCGVLVLAFPERAPAQDAEPGCAQLLQQRLRIIQGLNSLEDVKLPSDGVREMKALVEQLKMALGGSGINDVAKLAEQFNKEIEKHKPLPFGAEEPLKKISQGIKSGKGHLDDVLKALDIYWQALDLVDRLYQKTEAGSGADAIAALRTAFDEIRAKLPVSDIPGLNALFQAYSDSIGALEESIRRIESQAAKMNETMRQLGDDPIYVRFKSKREQLADDKMALQALLNSLDAQIDAAGCQRPGSPLTPDFSTDCDSAKVNRALKFAQRSGAVKTLEAKIEVARWYIFDAQDKLDRAKALEDAAAIKAAQEKLEAAQAKVKELQRQLGVAIRQELAKAGSFEPWDPVDYEVLRACLQKFADRVAEELDPDKLRSTLKQPAKATPPKPTSPKPSPAPCKGIVGCVEEHETKKIPD